MPPVETTNLKERAVLWEFSGYGPDGDIRVLAPVEIPCRWEESESQGTNPNGTPITFTGSLFVARDIPINSILFLGCQEDTCGTGTGFILDANLHCVHSRDKVPDIKNRNRTRKLRLYRYSRTLPTVET